MATGHENWLEQGEIYALGVLDGQELKDFEAHLASGCAICDAYVRETRETLTLLHRSLSPMTPSAAVKTRVFDQITPKTAAPMLQESRAWFAWRWWFLGAGSFATAAIVLTLIWSMTSTRDQLKKLESQIAVLQNESAQKDELIRFLSTPEVHSVQLAGLDATPDAKGKLFWNPTTRRGLLVTFGLPKTAADKAYELWGIAGNEPVPAGVFSVDERGQAQFPVPQLAEGRKFDKFAVTLEPAGGVPKPTGPMVLLGSL
jgi:anti-sigma-K factor RskA